MLAFIKLIEFYYIYQLTKQDDGSVLLYMFSRTMIRQYLLNRKAASPPTTILPNTPVSMDSIHMPFAGNRRKGEVSCV